MARVLRSRECIMETTTLRQNEKANSFMAYVRRTLLGASRAQPVEIVLDARDELPNRWAPSTAAYELPALGWRYG